MLEQRYPGQAGVIETLVIASGRQLRGIQLFDQTLCCFKIIAAQGATDSAQENTVLPQRNAAGFDNF